MITTIGALVLCALVRSGFSIPPPIPPVDCTLVDCMPQTCPGAFVPLGECCEVCPPPDCSAAFCLAQTCPGAFVPLGECCEVCPPPDCSAASCLAQTCPGAFVPLGECCEVCPPPDCSAAFCLAQTCPGAFVPPGECCQVCPPPDCSATSCLAQTCPGAFVPPRKCCAVCPPPDCSATSCFAQTCPGAFVPEGECCAVCPISPQECDVNGTVYTEGQVVMCEEKCGVCVCVGGKVDVLRMDCAAPECTDAITPPGRCCPVCPTSPFKTGYPADREMIQWIKNSYGGEPDGRRQTAGRQTTSRNSRRRWRSRDD